MLGLCCRLIWTIGRRLLERLPRRRINLEDSTHRPVVLILLLCRRVQYLVQLVSPFLDLLRRLRAFSAILRFVGFKGHLSRQNRLRC